jgi:hypothetical protein
VTAIEDGKWSVRDTLTGTLYPQPNKLIAEKVAEMHGHCEVLPGWPEAAPPTDDEREALYDGAWRAISGRDEPWGGCAEREKVVRVAEFAAGFRRQVPITDAQVEAAARSNYQFQHRACVDFVPDWADVPESDPFKGAYRAEAREALQAARAAS